MDIQVVILEPGRWVSSDVCQGVDFIREKNIAPGTAGIGWAGAGVKPGIFKKLL